MDYKDRYNRLLDAIKELQKANPSDEGIQNWIKDNVPELRESEDDQHRKWILEYLYDGLRKSDEQFKDEFKSAIAWLKKQGEQKSDDNAETKFKAGDWVVFANGNVEHIESVGTHGYTFEDGDYLLHENCDKQAHLWSITDAKDGDVLYSPCLKLLWIFKGRDTVYCGCNLNYNDGAFCGEGYFFERPTDAIPATEEQRDTLMKAMADAGYTFDFDNKKLKRKEKK